MTDVLYLIFYEKSKKLTNLLKNVISSIILYICTSKNVIITIDFYHLVTILYDFTKMSFAHNEIMPIFLEMSSENP